MASFSLRRFLVFSDRTIPDHGSVVSLLPPACGQSFYYDMPLCTMKNITASVPNRLGVGLGCPLLRRSFGVQFRCGSGLFPTAKETLGGPAAHLRKGFRSDAELDHARKRSDAVSGRVAGKVGGLSVGLRIGVHRVGDHVVPAWHLEDLGRDAVDVKYAALRLHERLEPRIAQSSLLVLDLRFRKNAKANH